MADTGQTIAGTGTNVTGVGTAAWANPNNITLNDSSPTGNHAVASGNFSSATSSNYLRASNFGFTVPTGATIDGIVVDIRGRDGNAQAQDSIVRLVDASGTIVGDNKSAGASWTNTMAYHSFGGSSDLWGVSLSPSDVNDTDFGAVFAASNINAFGAIRIATIQITVYYTGGASGPTNLKSYNTNLAGNIKTIDTNAIANVKSLNTNT